MRLPEPFVARMREELGAEQGAALCAALDTAPPTSLRWNPAKTLPAERCGEPVPWSPEGRYLPSRPQFTLDSDLHAGAYYVQEASSQFLAHLLTEADIAGARVLDLCAAPGGKSTLYASLVGGDGLVVANEINRQRASVLADNVRRWGSGNTVVTLADPAAFGGFAGWFDVVGVDAPCSGEGMFRKLEQARAEWSAQQVGLCARRQREIIRQAWPLLRPGGLLIYSTCTFNREENERTLEDFAAEAGGELVATAKVACPESWGVVCGEAGPFQTFRFYPQTVRNYIQWELGSRSLFFLTVVCAAAVMPFEFKIAALALLVIRFLIVAIEVRRIARRLGESGMMGRYFVYDLLSPLWALALSVMLMRKDDRVWR